MMYKGVRYPEFNFLETIDVYCNTKEDLFEFYFKHINFTPILYNTVNIDLWVHCLLGRLDLPRRLSNRR